jgi:ketosteroid isomerase-like protein
VSQEDVEAVRAALTAFNSGDLAQILTLSDPQIEAEVPASISSEPDTYRGHEGIRRYFESFWDVMDEIHFEGEQFADAGQTIVVELRVTAKGRQTGILVEQRNAGVWTVRDGRVFRIRAFASFAEALEAAGLSPQLADEAD